MPERVTCLCRKGSSACAGKGHMAVPEGVTCICRKGLPACAGKGLLSVPKRVGSRGAPAIWALPTAALATRGTIQPFILFSFSSLKFDDLLTSASCVSSFSSLKFDDLFTSASCVSSFNPHQSAIFITTALTSVIIKHFAVWSLFLFFGSRLHSHSDRLTLCMCRLY